MRTEKLKVAIYDRETDYATKLCEFIRTQKRLPWETVLFTEWENLKEEEKIDILVVAERSFVEEMKSSSIQKIVVLNETGRVHLKQYENIDKYQAADKVYRHLLESYEELSGEEGVLFPSGEQTHFLGVYSPVKRCLQTNFSLTLAQLLAKEHSCLYINLECFWGDLDLFSSSGRKDLGELLYFLDAKQDKFALRMQIMTEKRGNLDYIPPMKTGTDLLSVQAKDWLRLLSKIEKTGLYEFVVMDLSDSVQGLFEILRSCKWVFTITREDRMSKSKVLQYEHLLSVMEYQDVLSKTKKCCLPVIKTLPYCIEQYTRGDLAGYIKKELGDLMKV